MSGIGRGIGAGVSMSKNQSAPMNQNAPNQSMSQQNLMNTMYNKENNNEEQSNQVVGSTFAEQNKCKYKFKLIQDKG